MGAFTKLLWRFRRFGAVSRRRSLAFVQCDLRIRNGRQHGQGLNMIQTLGNLRAYPPALQLLMVQLQHHRSHVARAGKVKNGDRLETAQ